MKFKIKAMPVNLTLLSQAAPLIVEAANAIFSKIKKKKNERNLEDQVIGHDEQLLEIEKRQEELYLINEEQSKVMKDLAEQNQKLITAVRNIKYIALAAIGASAVAIVFALIK